MRAGAHHQTSGHLPLRRFRSPLRRGSAISRIRAHGRASLRFLCVDRFLEETKRGAGPRSLGRAGADERRDQHGRNVQAACFHLGQHFEAIHLGHLEVADQATRARHHVRRQECRADANSRASPPSERTKLPAAARTKDHRRQWIRDRRLRVKRHPCLWRRGRNGPSRALLPKLPAYRHAAAPPSYLRMGMPGAVHGPFDEDPGNARC